MTDTPMNPGDGFPAGFSEAYVPDVVNGLCVLFDFGSEIPPIAVGFVTLGRKHGTGIPFVFDQGKKEPGFFCFGLNDIFRHSNFPPFVISTYLRALESPTQDLPQILTKRLYPSAGDSLLVLDWGKSPRYGVSGEILAFGACSVGLNPNIGAPLLIHDNSFARKLRRRVLAAYNNLPISDRKWGIPRGNWKIVLPTTQILYG